MPLFTLPKYTPKTFVISPSMKTAIDSGLLDESQIKKFDRFPYLLAEELDNEERHPDISNLEKDIFDAVYRNDFQKFMRCVSRVGHNQDLLARIYNWLLMKGSQPPNKEESDLEFRESEFVRLNALSNRLLDKQKKKKLTEQEVQDLKDALALKKDYMLSDSEKKKLKFYRDRRLFTKRDLDLLKRVEGAKSVFNIFDY